MDDRLLHELRAEIERLETRLGEVEAHAARRRWAPVTRVLVDPRIRWAALAIAVMVPIAAYATVIVPNTFVNGTIADANEVNANFTALADEINLHEAGAAEHHAKTTDASELITGTLPDARLSPAVSLLGTGVSVGELEFDPSTQAELDAHTGVFGLHAVDASAHHAPYSDQEAILAVGPHVTSVDELSGGTISSEIRVHGLISSTSEGFRFPDSTIQTTAAVAGAVVFPNRILVAPSGGDFTSIQAAIDSVTPTAANPYLIDIAAGTYAEDLVLKSYLHLRGAGIGATVITPISASQHLGLTSLSSVKISQLTLFDDTTAGAAIAAGIFATATSLELVDMRIEGYQSWQVRMEAGSSLRARRIEFETGGQAETGITLDSSDAVVADSRFEVQSCAIEVTRGSLALTGSELDAISDLSDVCVRNPTPAAANPSIALIGNRLAGGIEVSDHVEIRITGNDIGGRIRIDSLWAEIVGNRIGFPTGPGGDPAIHILNGFAEIAGNSIEGGSGGGILNEGSANITGNRLSQGGSAPGITNTGSATIVSNHIAGSSTGTRIIDQGEAMIMANQIDGGTLGIDVSAAVEPTVVVGNLIKGSTGPEPPERWVSNREVRMESTADNVVLVSGGSTITVEPSGKVRIEGATDIDLTAGTDLNLAAGGIIDLSAPQVTVDGTSVLTLKGGSTIDVDAPTIDIDASNASVSAASTLSLTGGLVDIN